MVDFEKYNILASIKREIPLEHVSFNETLLKELKQLGIIEDHKRCVHILTLNKYIKDILKNRIENNVQEAYFQYGQLLFLDDNYIDAAYYFNEGAKKFNDLQCIYQMGVMYYEGLGHTSDATLGCAYMKYVLTKKDDPIAQHLIYAAAFNLGRSYYMGYGVKQSDNKAEEWWLFAADEGSVFGSIHAQSMLGYYYSTPDHVDLKKSAFWHSQACGNGSVESQGVLGVMYFLGLGKKVDFESALVCLRAASQRGDIYARGILCYYYFTRHLYVMAATLSAETIHKIDKIEEEAKSDSMRKGISIACFIYGRCLNFGLGVQKDVCLSQIINKKSFAWNADITAYFQKLVQAGLI